MTPAILDQGDRPHRRLALGTLQRIGLVVTETAYSEGPLLAASDR